MRTLIAGFGNVLRGDDGFGVAVVDALETRGGLGDSVILIEVGTGGLQLAQALLDRFDRVIVVDAMAGGSAPGTLYVRRVESVAAATEVDLHLTVPAQALAVAQALDALPAEAYLIGCEPVETDELHLGLSPVVAAAVARAVHAIDELLARAPALETTP